MSKLPAAPRAQDRLRHIRAWFEAEWYSKWRSPALGGISPSLHHLRQGKNSDNDQRGAWPVQHRRAEKPDTRADDVRHRPADERRDRKQIKQIEEQA